jgi:hypothetical protein
MAFRFRRRRGLRVNLSKSGASTSVGRRRYTDQQPASRRFAGALLVLFVIGLVVAAMVFFG